MGCFEAKSKISLAKRGSDCEDMIFWTLEGDPIDGFEKFVLEELKDCCFWLYIRGEIMLREENVVGMVLKECRFGLCMAFGYGFGVASGVS